MSAPGVADYKAGFVTFGTLQVDHPKTAAVLVDVITNEVNDELRHAAGFISSRVHVSLDGRTVVNRGLWASEAHILNSVQAGLYSGALCSASQHAGVLSATLFSGTRAAGIEGPSAAEEPGFVVVATRHVGGHESARAVVALLLRTGEWKRHSPGFISATPYISTDGMTYINYPQWVNEAAYQAYMTDSRIAAGQDEIARFEVAPPQFVPCTVVADIHGPRTAAVTTDHHT